MRYLVFSDIHGNLEAFTALLEFIQTKKIDHYLFLGDLVGYGANPNEAVETIQGLRPLSIIRGNHDKAVCDLNSIESFNPLAATAILWTKRKIQKEKCQFLCNLKRGPLVIHDSLTVFHGAPFDEDYYIFGEFDAVEAFYYLNTPLNFFGHTHFPVVFRKKENIVEGSFLFGDDVSLEIEEDIQYLINPGSIGQPRDRDPRASCAIYDSEEKKIVFHRIPYNISEAQRKILAADLPPTLAERLSLGI